MNTLTVTLRGLYVIVTVNYNMLIDFEVHYSVCLLIHLSLNLWFLLVNIKMRLHSLSIHWWDNRSLDTIWKD